MSAAESKRSPAAHKINVLTSEGLLELLPAKLPSTLRDLSRPQWPVTWIHAQHDEAVVKVLDEMGLDEIAVKSLRDGPERPRVEEFTDHLYISVFSADRLATRHVPRRGTDEAPPAPISRLRELRLFLGANWVISVGHIDPSDYDILAQRMRRQVFSRDRGPSFVAYHICEWLVESLQPMLERLDDRIDALEDQVVLTAGEELMRELFALKRDLVDLRRRVSPLRDVMQRLGSHGVVFVQPEAEVYFRDVHDDVLRAIELLDTYRDILSSALDLHLSSVSNRLNRVMKQLTVVATMFMPLSFLVGLFGTNFTAMPYRNLPLFIGMFVLLLVSVAVMWLYTWRRT